MLVRNMLTNIILKTYTGKPIKVLGTFNAKVKYEEQQYNLPMLVVDGDGPSLFGHNWLSVIILDWKSISPEYRAR